MRSFSQTMNKKLVLSVIIGILVITAAILVYEQQAKRPKNTVSYANPSQIEEQKILELRQSPGLKNILSITNYGKSELGAIPDQSPIDTKLLTVR